ncbi:MAG: DMT family transporter [Myxococcota bacterium]
MALHTTSGRTRLGIALATTTMLAWATLPIVLSVLIRTLEPETLTWFRFTLSAVVLALFLSRRGGLPRLRSLSRVEWALLAAATLGLASNYVLFLVGLELTTAANVQILMQLSPLLLALGGIAIFGERLSRIQWTGLGIIVAGLALFFSDQLRAFIDDGSRYLLGCAALVAASLLWAVYGLAQKQLLVRFSSPALLLCIYTGCALFLAPLIHPTQIAQLSGLHFALLIYCAANTLVAYGAFSASLEHLEASRVGAIIALTPIATFGLIALTQLLEPGALAPEHFSGQMLFGAGAVVAGSVLTSRG